MKRSINRRSFLKWMGVAPVAAKQATEAAVAELSHVSPRAVVGSYVDDKFPPLLDSDGMYPSGTQNAFTWEALRALGTLPEWWKQEMRDQAKRVTVLDPDIVSFKSWSLSAKIAVQQERNFAREEAKFWESGDQRHRRMLWEKIHGRWDHWL